MDKATVIDRGVAALRRHERDECGAVQSKISIEHFEELKQNYARIKHLKFILQNVILVVTIRNTGRFIDVPDVQGFVLTVHSNQISMQY